MKHSAMSVTYSLPKTTTEKLTKTQTKHNPKEIHLDTSLTIITPRESTWHKSIVGFYSGHRHIAMLVTCLSTSIFVQWNPQFNCIYFFFSMIPPPQIFHSPSPNNNNYTSRTRSLCTNAECNFTGFPFLHCACGGLFWYKSWCGEGIWMRRSSGSP